LRTDKVLFRSICCSFRRFVQIGPTNF